MNNVLFLIPIYLRSPEQYEKERLELERKRIAKNGEFLFGKKVKEPWPPWECTDVVGYFKVIINSRPGIHGHIHGITVWKYFTGKKRINRIPGERKCFIETKDAFYHTRLPCYYKTIVNVKQALLLILNELYDSLREKRNKRQRYHIDVDYYRNIIECLDLDKYAELVNRSPDQT